MKKTTAPVARIKLRKGERFILFIIGIFALLTPISIVYSYASLSSSNIEVEKLKKEIEKQTPVSVFSILYFAPCRFKTISTI